MPVSGTPTTRLEASNTACALRDIRHLLKVAVISTRLRFADTLESNCRWRVTPVVGRRFSSSGFRCFLALGRFELGFELLELLVVVSKGFLGSLGLLLGVLLFRRPDPVLVNFACCGLFLKY